MPFRPRSPRAGLRRTSVVGGALALLAALSGCGVQHLSPAADQNPDASPSASATPTPVSKAAISANIPRGARGVAVDKVLHLKVAQGTFRQVRVLAGGTALPAKLSADRTSFRTTAPLQPGLTYRVRAVAVDADGLAKPYRAVFHTRALTLAQQTFPSFYPTGGTFGVAMPVIIKFDVPVTDKASIERHLQVVSQPAQVGAFHWISDYEVHWRPKSYWRPGTHVTVKADIDSVPAGNGVYGQLSRQVSFDIGRSQVSKVNINTDQLQVFRGGQLIRTIPITTGRQPDFTTRSGIKVIVEKKSHTRMNSETIGIDPNSADGYNLDDVRYAMRLTYSGEFLHAAPWSVAYQGHENVSHGCTGMSTSNAQWLFDNSIVGDPVEYTGTDKWMTLTNGFGDWNESFAEYRAGSAL
jgi:lipoprotein-anchoring transpeptidase ErfK/SrfK